MHRNGHQLISLTADAHYGAPRSFEGVLLLHRIFWKHCTIPLRFIWSICCGN